MEVLKSDSLPIRTSEDMVSVRTSVRKFATELRFGIVDQTKIVTAASEIARNTLDYGRGGDLRMEALSNGTKRGLRLIFTDRGPGIRDIERALTDGFTSGNGMGLGLGGTRRLMDEFEIASKVNEGTTVTITKWSR
ncbi:anti-sigma regulatory factor [Paracidobacterium acidisoli]|uniref:Anti-sigma regulatory factor n=1 Tax=Paracidobacterium acidisoli TaxID=2303751 RepID=A0A372ITN8_9BACT|nr:anti-sigma regulatory factor [Paracidobacterium acidisoli]MBT9329568.1 anti-sigma regulatory factor [Paracidobacterium acidisoli]